MIKPFWPDGGVYFPWNPGISIFHAMAQHFLRNISRCIQETPVGFPYITSFCAYPSKIGSIAAIVPDHDIGLQLTHQFIGIGPIIVGLCINFAGFVGSSIVSRTTIGPIIPHFKNIAVIAQELLELVAKVGDVGWLAIISVVAIPGREVYAKF